MRERVLFALLSFMLAGCACSKVALAEKRVALLIGNGAYSNAPPLPNPAHDAAAIADKLRAAGFDVVDSKIDLGVAAMRRALRDFSDQARDADVAIVFYAGHGMEMNGINYMVPIDAKIMRDVDVEDEAISLDRVVRTIEGAKRLQLVILDSCRDNPFVRSMRRTIATRSLRSGHADIDEKALPSNTLIAYAQKAGATAEDGAGFNSPYTTGLLKHLLTPGLDVELALRRVRDEVLRSTANRQEPYKYGSLGGAELPLVPVHTSAAAGTAPETREATPAVVDASTEWSRVDKSSVVELETFLRRHGQSSEAEYARSRMAALKQTTPQCNVDGKWEQTATDVGSSTWILTRSGNNQYKAQEEGMGNAVGTAVFVGHRIKIDWRTGDWSGIYEWLVDAECATGEGQLIFHSGGSGTHRSVARRLPPPGVSATAATSAIPSPSKVHVLSKQVVTLLDGTLRLRVTEAYAHGACTFEYDPGASGRFTETDNLKTAEWITTKIVDKRYKIVLAAADEQSCTFEFLRE